MGVANKLSRIKLPRGNRFPARSWLGESSSREETDFPRGNWLLIKTWQGPSSRGEIDWKVGLG